MDVQQKKTYKAKISGIESPARGVNKVSLKIEGGFSFEDGQYIWLEIPDMKIRDEKGNRRAFSIACAQNSDNIISIVARISESGYKQSLFALKVGDEVIVHGPFGQSFSLDRDIPPKNLIIIAGGVGIAPYLNTLESLKKRQSTEKPKLTRCFLVYLNKDKESTPFLSDLAEYKKSLPFFDYVDKYEYFSWSDVEKVKNEMGPDIEWWIDGPAPMIDHVYRELGKGGVSRAQMVFENFYPVPADDLTIELVNLQMNSRNMFVDAIQKSSNHSIITDINGIILFASAAVEQITGFSKTEIIGNTPRLWGGMMGKEFYKEMWKTILAGETFKGTIANRRKNGDIYYARASIAPILDSKNNIIGFIGTEEDTTKEVEIDNTKKEFLSIASHQLRTPATAINWYSEMLINGEVGKLNRKQKEYLSEIRQGDKRMIELINNLLTISRFELGTFKSEMVLVDLKNVIEESVSENQPQIKNRKLKIEKIFNDQIKPIKTDAVMLKIICDNLISNAVNYSKDSGAVQIKCDVTDKTVRIEVMDDGFGIPVASQGLIFSKFFRAENAKLARPDGNGLGLYVTKSIVESLGGKISFVSEEDKGTTFIVELPIINP